jgi:hypothetical protein
MAGDAGQRVACGVVAGELQQVRFGVQGGSQSEVAGELLQQSQCDGC